MHHRSPNCISSSQVATHSMQDDQKTLDKGPGIGSAFVNLAKKKLDIEIQPGFEPGSSEFRCSYQLSHWSSGIGTEDRCIDTGRFRGWISLRLRI